jgi:hypothetical protein
LLKGLDPNAGLRIGRYFTPVFGLAVESNAYFSNKPWQSVGTTVRALNTSVLGTVNLSNWFGGYKGEPRAFEVSALYGFGWGHVFGNSDKYVGYNYNQPDQLKNAQAGSPNIVKTNSLTSKAALDFAFNLGEKKACRYISSPPSSGSQWSGLRWCGLQHQQVVRSAQRRCCLQVQEL